MDRGSSRLEASSVVFDILLLDSSVWQTAQTLLASKKPKGSPGPKHTGEVVSLRNLETAFNAYTVP